MALFWEASYLSQAWLEAFLSYTLFKCDRSQGRRITVVTPHNAGAAALVNLDFSKTLEEVKGALLAPSLPSPRQLAACRSMTASALQASTAQDPQAVRDVRPVELLSSTAQTSLNANVQRALRQHPTVATAINVTRANTVLRMSLPASPVCRGNLGCLLELWTSKHALHAKRGLIKTRRQRHSVRAAHLIRFLLRMERLLCRQHASFVLLESTRVSLPLLKEQHALTVMYVGLGFFVSAASASRRAGAGPALLLPSRAPLAIPHVHSAQPTLRLLMSAAQMSPSARAMPDLR